MGVKFSVKGKYYKDIRKLERLDRVKNMLITIIGLAICKYVINILIMLRISKEDGLSLLSCYCYYFIYLLLQIFMTIVKKLFETVAVSSVKRAPTTFMLFAVV